MADETLFSKLVAEVLISSPRCSDYAGASAARHRSRHPIPFASSLARLLLGWRFNRSRLVLRSRSGAR